MSSIIMIWIVQYMDCKTTIYLYIYTYPYFFFNILIGMEYKSILIVYFFIL